MILEVCQDHLAEELQSINDPNLDTLLMLMQIITNSSALSSSLFLWCHRPAQRHADDNQKFDIIGLRMQSQSWQVTESWGESLSACEEVKSWVCTVQCSLHINKLTKLSRCDKRPKSALSGTCVILIRIRVGFSDLWDNWKCLTGPPTRGNCLEMLLHLRSVMCTSHKTR